MAFVPLKIPAGVVKLATPLQTKGRYWDANMIRWRGGKLLPVGGWDRITSSPLGSTIRTIFAWRTNDNQQQIVAGAENYLYHVESETSADITPDGYVGPEANEVGGYGAWTYGSLLYGDDTDGTYPRPVSEMYRPQFSWTIDNWGEDILAVSSSDGRLLHWEVGEAKANVVGTAAITTATRTSNVITFTTADAHGYQAGDVVVVSGNTETSFNDTWTIDTAPTSVTFTVNDSGTNTTGTGGTAVEAGVPTNNVCVVVTPERHAVLGGADNNPRRIAWSNREDYTNWDFADPTTTAGYIDIDSQSKITMMATVREGTLIWTENEAWLMRYVGLPYVYAVERIGYGCGLIAPRAFATSAGRCYWMGLENFWMYDGGVVKPIPCDVASYVFDEIDPASGTLYTHGSDNGVFPEVWFWYPSQGSTVPDQYVIFSYAEGWWSIGEMTRTAAFPAGVYGYPIATDQDNEIYFQENGWTNAGLPLVGVRYAETGTVNIQDGNQITTVRQAMTDSGYGYNSTSLTVYTSFTPEGAETTSGPYNPRSDGYTDMRATGREMRFKIEATQDAPWSIGEMRVDIVPRGRR